jgi:hypothetical protein
VTRAFAEFGNKDDWVSKTLLKHALAAIIQASAGHDAAAQQCDAFAIVVYSSPAPWTLLRCCSTA